VYSRDGLSGVAHHNGELRRLAPPRIRLSSAYPPVVEHYRWTGQTTGPIIMVGLSLHSGGRLATTMLMLDFANRLCRRGLLLLGIAGTMYELGCSSTAGGPKADAGVSPTISSEHAEAGASDDAAKATGDSAASETDACPSASLLGTSPPRTCGHVGQVCNGLFYECAPPTHTTCTCNGTTGWFCSPTGCPYPPDADISGKQSEAGE
jgi:hypothetical protein